jgi:RecB family exonuclease
MAETFIVPTVSLKVEGDEVVLRYKPEPMPADPKKATRQLLEALLARAGRARTDVMYDAAAARIAELEAFLQCAKETIDEEYARADRLTALLKEAKEVLRDVVADENCWGDRAEALLARLEEG